LSPCRHGRLCSCWRSEVDIFHAQAAAFRETKPTSVQKWRHQEAESVQPAEDAAHFFSCQHDGQAPGRLGWRNVRNARQVDLQHLTIEKQQRVEGLVLGARCYFVVYRWVGEKGADSSSVALIRMTHFVI